MAALMIFALLAFLGMGTDVGYLVLRKRQMQNAADAGAMWAVQEIRRVNTGQVQATGRAGTAENLFPDGVQGIQVTVNHPPLSGGFMGDNLAVEVIICQPQRTFFMGALDFTSSDVCARGVAAVAADSESCIYAMNPTDEKTMYVSSSNAVLDAECGVTVNSRNDQGLYVDSGACMSASSIGVTADGYHESGVCNVAPYSPNEIYPPPITETPPEPDPLAHLVPPPMTDCPPGIVKLQISSDTTISPNTYCEGMQISNGAQVTLNPGIYVFRGEMLDIQGVGTRVTGNGVMLYFTDWPSGGKPSKGLKLGSAAILDLTAPTAGPYEGIAIFVDRDLGNVPFHTADVSFESNSLVTINGAIYALNQIVRVHSQSLSGNGLGQGTAIVGDTIEVTSSDTVMDVNADFSFLPGGSPLKKPTLVE